MSAGGNPRLFTFLRPIWLAGTVIVVYLLFDWVSYIDDLEHTEITPWAPQVALLIAVVMYYGARAAPLTIITPGIAEWAMRGSALLSSGVLGATICIGCSYTIAGLVLRRIQQRYPQPTIGWFATFSVVISVAALLDALLYSVFLTRTGKLPPGLLLTGVRTDWVGDVNGIVVLVPLFVLLYFGEPGKLREVGANVGSIVVQAASLACAFLVTFPEIWGFPQDDTRNPFYLLYLPMIWIALRWGACVTAIALAALQLGIVVFVARQNTPESFLSIQVLMVFLTCTGLFLGISVSENARINQLIKSKDVALSRLNARMAVSELNAAIGHELNNPLAALVNYLRSASLMLELPGFDRVSLQNTLVKAHGEATRSINVLRKLREFFRSGVVRRESVDPRMLAAEALAAMQVRFRQANIAAVVGASADIPLIEADPLQVAMVLQNLLANAYDAVQACGAERGRIAIGVAHIGNEVLMTVSDTGTGIPDALRDRLFRPVDSTKPAGMGLGLAICRSLVEANYGRISVVRSGVDGTCIGFYIPVAKPGDSRGA
jgi:two-component system, LuxR family, sensor kinase FixL